MDKPEGRWNALTSFFIRHSVAIFVVATACCLLLITYLTNHLKPDVVGAWVIVGILTSLLFSGVALVVVLAIAAVDKLRHLKVITFESQPNGTVKDRFERERLKAVDFYPPFFPINENKTFVNCEIEGPGSMLFLGTSSLTSCVFNLCDVIVVGEGVTVNTAAQFKDSTFSGCHFYNVALYMSADMAARLLASYKAATGEELQIIGFCQR